MSGEPKKQTDENNLDDIINFDYEKLEIPDLQVQDSKNPETNEDK
jgi:hypothetical protein